MPHRTKQVRGVNKMTTEQNAQAIDQAYAAFVALYNSNASLAEQNAAFEKYQALWDAAMERIRG